MINERILEQLMLDENSDDHAERTQGTAGEHLASSNMEDDNNSASIAINDIRALLQPVDRSITKDQIDYLSPPNQLPAFYNPRLEAIILRLRDDRDFNKLLKSLGDDWRVEEFPSFRRPCEYELLPTQKVSTTQAWNIVHELRNNDRVLNAEPSWEIDMVAEETQMPGSDQTMLSATAISKDNKFWAPEFIHTQQAWDLPLPLNGKLHGEGIRIAHPDTGDLHHVAQTQKENGSGVYSGFDFLGDLEATGANSGDLKTKQSHSAFSGTEGDILGLAPKATLVPMRISQKGLFARPAPLLVRIGMRRLSDAIDMAIKTDCHVISISHGWLGHAKLKEAISRAWKHNIIIIAAAGNYTGSFISAPAKYAQSICVAGCDANSDIWKGSARGTRVDFCAPAQDVWKEGFLHNHITSMQCSSTAFAAAMTTGVAALWLAYHGRDRLIQIYGSKDIPLAEVFRYILKHSSKPAPRKGFGRIIDAERALKIPLPSPKDVLAEFKWEALNCNASSPNTPSLASALEILGDDYRNGRRQLASSLNVPENQLERIAANCGDELAFHILLALARDENSFKKKLATVELNTSAFSERLKAQLAGKWFLKGPSRNQ